MRDDQPVGPIKLPKGPRFEQLVERIEIIIERNPEAFPTPVATHLLAPMAVVADARYKEVDEHGGLVAARMLLDWDVTAQQLVICVGSFTAPDDREPADDLDAPTILAWRLLEDLCAAADQIEDALIERGTWAPKPEPTGLRPMAVLTDQLLAANPQFFPPFLFEALEKGVAVIETPPADDPNALGLFDYDPHTGSSILIVHPNILETIEGLGAPTLARELLITLCHEFEHLYGSVRGRDPLANREWFFDRHF